jgi:enamine deaminase RidA (YjgF/YER057c/UK114 family)
MRRCGNWTKTRAYRKRRKAWGDRPNPPTLSVLLVAGLAHPDFLVEIDAVAVIPAAD